jgi:uncharacterized protein
MTRRISGPTILLKSGEYFSFIEPAASAFTIEDIAHGLSMVCRFAGECRTFHEAEDHCASRMD